MSSIAIAPVLLIGLLAMIGPLIAGVYLATRLNGRQGERPTAPR